MSKCTECNEYDKEKFYCPKWCEVIKGTIEDARKDEWQRDMIIAYNRAIEDFAENILNWKPQDEEYRSFKDVVNEVKNQLIRKTFKEGAEE